MSLINGLIINADRLRFGLTANNPAHSLDHHKPLVIRVMCWDKVLSVEAGREFDLGLDGAVVWSSVTERKMWARVMPDH